MWASDNGHTVCPRGSGYSYADMILNDGNVVLDTRAMNHILTWDAHTGVLVAEPGVTFAQILRTVTGSGWTIASCVGGMGVSLGGAVSNNVHGKDSWKVGNFGRHVLELKLLTADGSVINVDRRSNASLFQAVVGGMGVLGVIVEITLQLLPTRSAFVEVVKKSVRDLGELLDTLNAARETSDFVIAWVDAFATGKALGRGTVETSRWSDSASVVDVARLERSLTVPSRLFGVLPANLTFDLARPFFGAWAMRLANQVKYKKDRLSDLSTSVQLFSEFNFMLNRIPGWKRLYRPQGYLEFQPMLPREEAIHSLTHVLKLCQTEGFQSLLCAIKPHPVDDYLLSYQGDGFSIGIDVALRGRSAASVRSFADRLYGYVADQGGLTFLAKDEVLTRSVFRRMYPQWTRFVDIKHQFDDGGLFGSDMYRRLVG